MITRVMLDLETLGTRRGAVFFSLAAVEFTGGQLGREFDVLIDPDDAERHGLTVDVETFGWWLRQRDAAKCAALMAWEEGKPLVPALEAFADWLDLVRQSVGGEGLEIWANAPSLDCALVDHGFLTALKRKAPWQFWKERCYRTLKNLRRDVPPGPRGGTAHVALDDARHQATHAIALLEALGCADWPVTRTVAAEPAEDIDAGDLFDEGTRVIVPDGKEEA